MDVSYPGDSTIVKVHYNHKKTYLEKSFTCITLVHFSSDGSKCAVWICYQTIMTSSLFMVELKPFSEVQNTRKFKANLLFLSLFLILE